MLPATACAWCLGRRAKAGGLRLIRVLRSSTALPIRGTRAAQPRSSVLDALRHPRPLLHGLGVRIGENVAFYVYTVFVISPCGETAHSAACRNLPGAVKFRASKGARIDLWNRENKYGWTPLAIAAGYRFGNFKPSPDTEAALREVMIAAGVKPPDKVTAKTQQID